jgi:hypothetical protein
MLKENKNRIGRKAGAVGIISPIQLFVKDSFVLSK